MIEYVYDGEVYRGIQLLNVNTLAQLPKSPTEATNPTPSLAMVQNEDQVDIWLVDPSDVVKHTEEIRRFYREQEEWVINHPRFLIRLFSLAQEIVY